MTEAPQQDAPAVEVRQETQGFTQEDVNKIAGTRAKEAKQAAINDLLERTGAESIDDVLAAYSEYQGIHEAVTTEADRERTAREKAEKRAQESDGLYETTLREFALKDALRDAGINSGRLPLALKVADMDGLEVDRKTRTVSGVESVVENIREASPEWFEAQEERRRITSPDATRQPRPQDTSYEGQMGGFLNNLLGAP